MTLLIPCYSNQYVVDIKKNFLLCITLIHDNTEKLDEGGELLLRYSQGYSVFNPSEVMWQDSLVF